MLLQLDSYVGLKAESKSSAIGCDTPVVSSRANLNHGKRALSFWTALRSTQTADQPRVLQSVISFN